MLEGKIIVITGAAAGIGLASAQIAAGYGAEVWLFDRDEAAGKAAASAIRNARFQLCDVAVEDQVVTAFRAVLDHHGRLDGLCNNAGVEMTNVLVTELSLADWNHVTGINLTGVFLCMKHAMRAMGDTGGSIVNISSGDGAIGQPYACDYVASKHGVIGLTRAASCEAATTKVRVNAIMPGLILTPMVEERLFKNPAFASQMEPMATRHSIGRFGKPEDVGEAVAWFLSDRSAFVNGAALAIDGGYIAR